MSNAHDGHPEDHEGAEKHGLAVPPGGSRRRLLGRAASGLMLAASGVFVLDWLEETEAREGALGGAKGGRHGKNRRGRHRRHTHGNRKDKDNRRNDAPRGGDPIFRSSALTVVNRTDAPLEYTFYYRIKTGLDGYALPTASGTQTITPGGSYRYDPDRYRVGVLMKTNPIAGSDFYVDVRNVSFWFPRGGVTKGTNLDPHSGNIGTVLIPEQDFVAGGRVKKGGVVLQRLGDSDRIEWEVTIS